MKKISTIILLILCSLSINAHSNDSIYVTNNMHGVRYLYHTNKECSKVTRIINEYDLSDMTVFKFRNCVPCKDCVTSTENDLIYSFIKNKKYIINDIYACGYYQSKSATYRGLALGLGCASATTAVIGASCSSSDSSNALYIISGVLGAGAIISEIISINYQFKSGNSLKIGAGKITYNF